MFGDVATRARRRVIKSGAIRGLKERSKVNFSKLTDEDQAR
ncbi:hypothetical protein HanXRQr2_Chr03g0089921 [Helianthus annuus]|uniref:Uncharacterized protein n=1 Tax=Helianthus annuus TaxID=4232 RepID=A0A9K3NU49_HELAN|nr:hypothetical protein HanXRQr2_Chr03g0089921 [Helianthus annuus]